MTTGACSEADSAGATRAAARGQVRPVVVLVDGPHLVVAVSGQGVVVVRPADCEPDALLTVAALVLPEAALAEVVLQLETEVKSS